MDLILQAPTLDARTAESIAGQCGAASLHVLDGGGQRAWRLVDIRSPDGVPEACARARCDYALVPPGLVRGAVRVVAMDMDSTLITIECIDEIADLQGIKPAVAAITASAMRGEIDFRESLARRVALLAGLPVDALAEVYDRRLRLSPGAERMLAGFRAHGAKTLLVSGGFTYFTDRLQARLGLDATASNTLEVEDGRLTGRLVGDIVDAEGKARHLRAMRARHAADGGLVLALGDGANDLPMLAAADVSIAYRAKPLVRAQATYALDYCGLDGALNLLRLATRAAAARPRLCVQSVSSIHAIWIASRIFSPLLPGASAETGQRAHPGVQVGEADGAADRRPGAPRRARWRSRACRSISSRTLLRLVDRVLRDLEHELLAARPSPGRTAATPRSAPRRDRAGRPRRRSTGASEPKPSRTITWQVVHAQDFSQACSISTSLREQAVADRRTGRAPRRSCPRGRSRGGEERRFASWWVPEFNSACRPAAR